jgi:Tfp pilus assembly protein PilF
LAQAATLLASPAPEARALGESLRGHFAYFEDNLKEAQADLNLALQTDPNNVNIQCSTATVDLANRQVELARSFFQVVIRGYPDWAKALNMMGNTYYGQKRWLEARAWDERALSCPVLHEPVLCNLAETYVRTGDLVRATCILRSVVENSPTFSAGHLNLGYALEKSGDWQGAAREYETVLELRPNDHEALKWLTGLYRRHGHPELAAQFDTRYGLASAHTAQPPQAGG